MSTPLTSQLVDTLHPRADVRPIVERAVDRLAAELDSPDLLESLVNAAVNPEGISTHDTAQQAACSERQLRYWTDEGYVTAMPGPRGSGHPQRYGHDAVVKARTMAALVKLFEMSPAAASRLADEMLGRGQVVVNGFTLTRSRFDR